ncbi:MAG: hypothetical protein IPP28_07825 [Xanthomonadales bacterium]|nr:hypothetical protein [Xanthomonadales bacterium]
MSTTKILSSIVLLAASTVALAEPSLLVTMEKSPKGQKSLLSFDFVADTAQPVTAIRFAIALKRSEQSKSLKPGVDAVSASERAILEKRISLGRCAESVSAPSIGMCGVGTGDLIVLVDGTASRKGIATGSVGTVAVPNDLLELDANGKVRLAFVEFVKTETGEMSKGIVVGDASEK